MEYWGGASFALLRARTASWREGPKGPNHVGRWRHRKHHLASTQQALPPISSRIRVRRSNKAPTRDIVGGRQALHYKGAFRNTTANYRRCQGLEQSKTQRRSVPLKWIIH
jgi:hypothetical protein